MAEFNLPFGVRIANNDPVDYDRYIATDIAARDAIVTAGRAYEGLQIYVESDQSLYILIDVSLSTWEIVGSDSSALAELDASIQTIGVGLNDVSIRVNNQDPSGVYLPLTGGSLSGDLTAEKNVDIGGNLTIDGSLYVVGTETIDVSAAYIHLNTGLTIPAPDYMQSGIIVERGTDDPYVFVFDESQEQFRIGISPFDGSEYIDASTQAVATREDAPVSQGITFWNASENRLDTSVGFTLDVLTGSTGYIPTYGSPLNQSTLSFSGGILKNHADENFIIESGYVGNLVGRNLIIRTPEASGSAGDIILKAGNSDTLSQRGNIILVPGDQPGQGIIELSDNSSANSVIYLSARGAGSNVGITVAPKGSGNVTLRRRVLIGDSNQFDFQYGSTYNEMEIKSDKPGYIGMQSSPNVPLGQSFTVKGSNGVDASFAGNLIISGGDAGNTGVGGSLVLTSGAGAGGDVDGSIYMLNIAEASSNKILFYNTIDGAVSYQDAPDTGVVPTDNILEWDSSNNYYRPYEAFSTGNFYTGTTTPTGNNRLNLDRELYLPKIVLENNTTPFSTTCTGGGNAVTANSNRGILFSGSQNTEIFSDATQPLVYITRTSSGDASTRGNIIHINDSPTVTGTREGAILYAAVENTRMMDLDPRVVDSSSAVAYYLNTVDTLSDSSAKLLSISNNNNEKFFINKDGSVWSNGVYLGAGGGGATTLSTLTDVSVGGLGAAQDGSALVYDNTQSAWTYSSTSDPNAGKTPLVTYASTSSITLDLGKDTRSKFIATGDTSILIDDASLSSEYSHTMVIDLTANVGTNNIVWDSSLNSDNWVDGDILGVVVAGSTYVVTINTNGNSYADIIINYVKKGL